MIHLPDASTFIQRRFENNCDFIPERQSSWRPARACSVPAVSVPAVSVPAVSVRWLTGLPARRPALNYSDTDASAS